MVATEFVVGPAMVKALDSSELSISVAMWIYAAEYEDWRFLLASRRLDEARPAAAYGLVHDALSAGGISLERTPPLMILKMSDPTIRELRQRFLKKKIIEGMHIELEQIGRRFVEDSIVYRIK